MSAEHIKWMVVCAVFSVTVLVVATLKYLRERNQKPGIKRKRRAREIACKEKREDLAIEAVKRKPIHPDQFLEWFRRKEVDRELHIELKALLKRQHEAQCITATTPENLWLNNLKDIIPYDHSRIILKEIPQGFTTDYINANYIDGFCKSKEYISTQGPQYRIAAGFWQMVWQEHVHCIVMATGLFEHATQQCDKYWEDIVNDYGQVQHGKISIRTIKTVSIAHLTIRTLQICKEGYSGSRIIKHFEMSSWEMDDTIDPGVILDARRRILKYMSSSSGPLLVHCRSGGARTAVFVAVDYCLKQLEVENYVDVFGALLHMHRSRKNMIRTLTQYRMIFDTVALYLQCSNSVFPTSQLSSLIHRLSDTCPQVRPYDFTNEFQVVQNVVPKLSIGDCAGGHRQENRSKSRDIMLQPPERARPYLLSNDKSDDSDFINGVYVDGYWQRNNYIITQWPMKNTVRDIWRLVYDYKIQTLVVLNDLKFSRSYPCFWPKEIGQDRKYGPIGVKYCKCLKYPDMTVRVFSVRKFPKLDQFSMSYLLGEQALTCGTIPMRDMKEEERPVRIFQLTNWPKLSKVPPGTMSLTYLLGLVEEWQRQHSSTSPICIMSKDGYSRCGLYCAISICCDRLKDEGEVDILNAVRVVKKNRPQLVPTIAEYIYCYKFMASLLEHLQEVAPKIVVTGTNSGMQDSIQEENEIFQEPDYQFSQRSSESSTFFSALDSDNTVGNFPHFHSALSQISHLNPCTSLSRSTSSVDTCSLYNLEGALSHLKFPWENSKLVNCKDSFIETNNNCIQGAITLPLRSKHKCIRKKGEKCSFVKFPLAKSGSSKTGTERKNGFKSYDTIEIPVCLKTDPLVKKLQNGRVQQTKSNGYTGGYVSLEMKKLKRSRRMLTEVKTEKSSYPLVCV